MKLLHLCNRLIVTSPFPSFPDKTFLLLSIVTAAEIRALWFHFKEISSTEEDDGIIDRTFVFPLPLSLII
jgi:hypothetical protein